MNGAISTLKPKISPRADWMRVMPASAEPRLRRATGSPSRIRIWLSGRSAERAGHVQGVAGRYNGGFAAKFICASVSWFMNVIVEVPLVS